MENQTSTDNSTRGKRSRRVIQQREKGDVDGRKPSMQILRNFNRYVAIINGQKDETIDRLCREVVSIMQKKGIFYNEKKDIRHIQASFKAALEWKNNTGREIEDSMKAKGEAEESIAKTIKAFENNAIDALRQRCPYWDDFEALMLSRPSVTGAGTVYSGDGIDPEEVFNCIAKDTEDQEETFSRSPSPDILLFEETPASNQVKPSRRPLFLTASEERPSKIARWSIENQLADVLRVSIEVHRSKIALEEKKLALKKLQFEQTLALERERFEIERKRLELDKRMAIGTEMHAKMAYEKFLIDSGIYTKEEVKDLLK